MDIWKTPLFLTIVLVLQMQVNKTERFKVNTVCKLSIQIKPFTFFKVFKPCLLQRDLVVCHRT